MASVFTLMDLLGAKLVAKVVLIAGAELVYKVLVGYCVSMAGVRKIKDVLVAGMGACDGRIGPMLSDFLPVNVNQGSDEPPYEALFVGPAEIVLNYVSQ